MSYPRIADELVPLGPATLRVRRVGVRRDAPLSAPVLVFLHDSLGCVETWRDFPNAVAERVGLDAIVYDRRGYGRSSPFGPERRTPRYLEDEAEVLFALLDALAIEQTVLFGHSDGGSISLIAAATRPSRVRAIVTEGAHVFVEEITLAGIRDARAALASTDLASRLARYHGDKVAGVTSAWIDTWLSPEFRDWNIEACLPRVLCPALVIQGERDEFGTIAQVDAIVGGLGGPTTRLVIPGVGHTPHRDAPAEVLDAAATFIASALAGEVARGG
jgi:pimeloyl-ACP methyl ester carboxylesterase